MFTIFFLDLLQLHS